MPLLILILPLFFSPIAKAQNVSDTVFLFRERFDSSYHAIYIDKKKSPFYQTISKHITIDPDVYKTSIQQLSDSGRIKTRHFNIDVFPEWYSLYLYKNKYYVYSPSEPYTNTYIKISDSTIVLNNFNDGCIPALLSNIDRINNKTLEIVTSGLYREDSKIIFHFLTKKKDVAVVEFPLREENKGYLLMVAKNSLRRFPIIVNYCMTNRVKEWEFDKPDFKKIIESRPLKFK